MQHDDGPDPDIASNEPHLILRDGAPVLIRRLVAEDAALYPDFLSEVTAEDLRRWVSETLASFKVPRYWKFTESFPMTVTGKIQKYRLRQMAVELLGREADAAEETA